MRISLRILFIFIGVIVLGCLLAPPVHMALRLGLGHGLGLSYFLDVPFDRVLSRVLLVLAFLFLIRFRRSLQIQESLRKSLAQSDRWFYLLRTGFILGLVSLFLLIAVVSACGAVRFHPWDMPAARILYKFCSALVSGLAIGFIEEIFFRGFVLQSLQREMKTRWALVITSVFYAILHYFKAEGHVALEQFQWDAGFTTASRFLAPFSHINTMIPGVIGLTFVGIVLGIAYLRTGSLYLSIGIHAGWVFLIKFDNTFTDRIPGASTVWFGDDKWVTGIAAWIMLLVVGSLIALWGRRLAQPR
jgi:uncharacterized protein